MKLKITVYKDTGKYYIDHVVEVPTMSMTDPGWLNVIRNNLPARYSDGIVTVEDAGDFQGFHQALYTWRYLFPEKFCEQLYMEMWFKRDANEITEEEFKDWFRRHCATCRYMSEVCMYGED